MPDEANVPVISFCNPPRRATHYVNVTSTYPNVIDGVFAGFRTYCGKKLTPHGYLEGPGPVTCLSCQRSTKRGG